jgi:peptidoglycan/LPS O-acetylase OafA/YrhL
VTFVLDALGSMLAPESYAAHFTFSMLGIGLQFAAGLLFLNEVWSHHILIGTNAPFWSLGYEVPYYIAFAGFAFAPGKWKWIVPLFVLAAYGPRIALLAPIWCMGLVGYCICSRGMVGMAAGWWLFIGSTATWAVFYLGIYLGVVPSTVAAVYWHHWEIWEDYAVGLMFAVNVVGFHAVSRVFAPLAESFHKPIRWIAGATFTLYLFHSPIAEFFIAVLKWPMNRPINMAGLTLIVFVLVYALAELAERRKAQYRKVFSRLLRCWIEAAAIRAADPPRRGSVAPRQITRPLPL